MFPGEENWARKAIKWTPHSQKMLIIYGASILAAISLIGVTLALTLMNSSFPIPANIQQSVKSPIYLPGKLPGNYRLTQGSFTLVEGDTVLIFNAEDATGSKLIFSEQARPKTIDFENFHKGNFENPKTLSDVPYPSVWGKAVDGRLALSIVTDDTWIMMATSSPLGDEDLHAIAASIKKF